MANFYPCPVANILQVLTDIGIPLSGGLIWTYLAGTTTPAPTYTDITGVTPNSNPIQLNSAGRLSNPIWQQGGVPLKIIFSTNAGTPSVPVLGTPIGPPFDQISGINDPFVATATGNFPAQLTGFSLTVNITVKYSASGGLVLLSGAQTSNSSNANFMALTGIPPFLRPNTGALTYACLLEDNGSIIGGWATISSGTGTINFGTGFNNNLSGFTSSGTKGLPAGWTVMFATL